MVWVHRLLIVTAMGGAAVFTVWSARAAMTDRDPISGGITLLALAITVGLGVYLRSLRGLAAKLTPRDPRD